MLEFLKLTFEALNSGHCGNFNKLRKHYLKVIEEHIGRYQRQE